MKKKERLALYEEALIDWERPRHQSWEVEANIGICFGFCYYFYEKKGIDTYDTGQFRMTFPELWRLRTNRERGVKYLFNSKIERAEALRGAIKLLK
jgi:hypothetical protein